MIGIIMTIMLITATFTSATLLIRKNDGTPMSAATVKHMSCLLVKPKIIRLLTFVRSLGTDIYEAAISLLPHFMCTAVLPWPLCSS